MSKPPAFQLYANDWLSSLHINLMTPAQEGAYIRLLCYAWADSDCSLPDDDAVLAQLSRLGEGWLKGGSSILRQCFVPHPEHPARLVNLKLLEVRRNLEDWRERSRQGGIKSGQVRASQSKGGSRVLQVNGNQPVDDHFEVKGNSSSSSSSSEEKEKRAVSTSSSPASGIKSTLKMADDAFIAELKQNAAYRGIDIDREIGKLTAWLGTPKGKGKYLTRQRLVNWLNRADVPMSRQSQPASRPREVVL
jgi:hypothetical protein